MSKSAFQKNHLVVKHNTLNELRPKDMGLQELRFFTIYLSKINPMDESTRLVRFSLADFQAFMELGSRIKIDYIQKITNSLLCKIINVPDEHGGYRGFQLFKECIVSRNDNGEWYVEIDAHDRALPLMFDFKGHYFKYELWNALRLKSKNQLRMYEILKQYERIGYRVISIKELREQLGINENEYPRYNDLKTHVIEVCRNALAENTDISYTYEPYGKKGKGGKILQLKFNIIKNKNFVDPLSLSKFIETSNDYKIDIIDDDTYFDEIIQNNNITPNSGIDLNDIDENGIVRSTGNSWIYEERIDYLMGACNNEFSREEMIVIYSIMQQKVPRIHSSSMGSHDYLQHKYRVLAMNDKNKGINNRFAYFKRLVEFGED